MKELEQLYQQYFKDVYLYAKSLAGEEQLAQDIASETFLKAIEAVDRFRGECDVRVWLCQIAKHAYFSYLRKHKKEQLCEAPLSQEEMRNAGSEEEQMLCQEDSMRLHQILHGLPEPYREVFSLRVFSELSFRQIGQLFGKTENWACVTFYRAKSRIKKRLEETL